MDGTLRLMAEFASGAKLGTLSPAAVRLTKRHLIDAVACGAGAFAGPAPRKIRSAIGPGTGSGASAYGITAPTLPEFAAFANASTNRYLDFNDFGPSGHPSDMMPAQLAMAESVGARGADVVRGVVVAYEVATALADAVPFTGIPFDVGLYYSAGAAAGMASIVGLDPEATANAISMAVVPSVPLRATRMSPVSEWRSSATALACMTAAFAARLARAGLTGPPDPFDGGGGVFDLVGRRPDAVPDPALASPSAVERGSLKRYQACFLAQSAIDAIRRIRAHPRVQAALSDPAPAGAREMTARIGRVTVLTTHDTWWYVGGGAGDREEKWSPRTRETADHSIPYIAATLLLEGDVDFDSYAPDALEARAWDPLIRRVEVVEDPGLTAGPDAGLNPVRVTLELADGQEMSASSTFPYDESGRPTVSGTDVQEKFFELAGRVLASKEAEELYDLLDHLDALDDLDRLGFLLRSFSPRSR
jgi:2-methylcitrate dehydratase